MILHSWNVNGLRAVAGKGFFEWLSASDSDVAGLQETKIQPGHEADFGEVQGYRPSFVSCTVKKGYSGVGAYYRREPLAVNAELPDPRFRGEGRLLHLEYPEFHFLTVYFPNGQRGQDRLDYKMGYYEAFLAHAQELRRTKPIVVCGDFNTAHTELDLKNPKSNEKTSGFLPEERAWLDRFTAHGYVDCFRLFEQGGGHYTWWDYRFQARSRNVGWRIDYFYVSDELRPRVKRAWIESQVTGSDHCPVGLELDLG
ncbi:Exodeoxyribonuclease [Fundidesulfovibrio magnetotacticus]|uniref:Exodeoxyribonuclease n=1 Tax=Fundidesulfovibrio magnetotacticus TaxID=2730080 RepID=A0A6V8LU67_9BACT|nr:exodeoxyribonuclease III [Fundidesulfovibrio magnetotacticus]GFK93346.1 Exodeoxyribonuclease [Fundidesulfovibrio magnetotacticus]